MIPIANFTQTSQGLSVSFTDSSLNVPTSWAWNFGDPNSGALNTSTVQNPSHNFTLPGIYLVALSSTNVDGTDIKAISLNVGEGGVLLSINEMISSRLPSFITMDPIVRDNYRKIEQLFLQPYLNIADADIFNEAAWSPLANVLVAELVVYKYITDKVNELVLAMAQSGSNSSGQTTTQGSGALKRLQTGPSEAEWFDSATVSTDFITASFKSGSTFDKTALTVICSLAQRLSIPHPYCPQLQALLATNRNVTVLPKVAYFGCKNKSDGY